MSYMTTLEIWNTLVRHVFTCGWGNMKFIELMLPLAGKTEKQLRDAVTKLEREFNRWCEQSL